MIYTPIYLFIPERKIEESETTVQLFHTTIYQRIKIRIKYTSDYHMYKNKNVGLGNNPFRLCI